MDDWCLESHHGIKWISVVCILGGRKKKKKKQHRIVGVFFVFFFCPHPIRCFFSLRACDYCKITAFWKNNAVCSTPHHHHHHPHHHPPKRKVVNPWVPSLIDFHMRGANQLRPWCLCCSLARIICQPQREWVQHFFTLWGLCKWHDYYFLLLLICPFFSLSLSF